MSMRTILITGATSGIGLATSNQLLDLGHHVIALGRNFDKVSWANDNLEKVCLNLAETNTLPNALSNIVKKYPNIDGLVLNAGQGIIGNLEQLSYQQIVEVIHVNIVQHIFLAKAFINTFKNKERGDIIFVGSTSGLRGHREGSVYCATKFAIRGFAQSLRDENSNTNIRVMLINPGITKTPFFDNLPIMPSEDPRSYLTPEDIAKVIVKALEEPQRKTRDPGNKLIPAISLLSFSFRS